MQTLLHVPCGGSTATIAHTTRGDGDLSIAVVDPGELIGRRRTVTEPRWAALRQVHSDRVVTIGAERAREISDQAPIAIGIGDGLVTDVADLALAMHSGDCVTIAFVHAGGAIGVAHAGWKGLYLGVVESTVRAVRALAGSGPLSAVIGPHISAANYAFGSADLAAMAARFGDGVRAVTTAGEPALDLRAATVSELDRLGVGVALVSDACTAAQSDRYWSHRARGESGRHALIAWIEP